MVVGRTVVVGCTVVVATELVEVAFETVVDGFVDVIGAMLVVAGAELELVVGWVWVPLVVSRAGSVATPLNSSMLSSAQAPVPSVNTKTKHDHLRNVDWGTLLEATVLGSYLLINRINLVCHICNHLREIR